MTSPNLIDPFASSGGGVPAVSWQRAKKGDVFEGIILPPDTSVPTKGYDYVQRTDTKDQAPLYWNPDRTAERRIFKDSETNGKPNQGVSDPVLTVTTAYRKMEFTSEEQEQRMVDDGRADDGMRRYFATGATGGTALKEALAKAKVKAPQVGGRIKVTLADRVPNVHRGKTNIFETAYAPPTPETEKVVADYLAKSAPGPIEDDPFGDDPPF